MKCRKCDHEITDPQHKCPNCGEKTPVISMGAQIFGAVFAIGVIAFLFWPESEAEKKEEADKRAAYLAECRKDSVCWGKEHRIAAEARCREPIEALAQYQVRWKDEPNGMFKKVSWLNQQQGSLKYIGDGAQFQNGFGAWSNYSYSCDYNPDTMTVLNIDVQKGRL